MFIYYVINIEFLERVLEAFLCFLWAFCWEVSAVEGYPPKFDVAFSNEPLKRRLFVEAGYEVRSVPFDKRKVYSSTDVRKRMVGGEDWERLVPKCVADCIEEIDGVDRL